MIVETCTETFRIAALAQHLRIPRRPDQDTYAAHWTCSRIRAGAPGPRTASDTREPSETGPPGAAQRLPAHLERVLVALAALSQQIADADTELRTLADADERMTRLMTVPGVGPVTAARFVAAIDDVGRFPTAASVAS